MKAVVNADDFGMSEKITKAIDEAFRNGWISQSTLMVNMPYADAAVRLAKKNGYWGRIGLHLNLTRGIPLTDEMRESHFCDELGVYDKSILTDKRMLLPYCKQEHDMIEKEIRAQIERFLSYGPDLMHADGHHHLHTRFPLTNIILPALNEYGFASVRRPYSIPAGFHFRTGLLAVRNQIFLSKARNCHLRTTKLFGGSSWFRMSGTHISPDGSIEIMTHPRYDNNGILVDTLDYEHNTGIPLAEVVEDLRRCHCEMVDFSDLAMND